MSFDYEFQASLRQVHVALATLSRNSDTAFPVESPGNLVRNVPENNVGLESRAFDFLRDAMDEDVEAD
ncbi:hypothetical protein CRV24_010334 [Beauveria bassiana]|nr:hypothetical protein CRV24_010334 [Beauveria bassiana]KAH8713710.1 hypothetical protein HC256_006834 [Beauveria bassiana]